MDLGVLLTLLEAAEGEGRSAGHGRQTARGLLQKGRRRRWSAPLAEPRPGHPGPVVGLGGEQVNFIQVFYSYMFEAPKETTEKSSVRIRRYYLSLSSSFIIYTIAEQMPSPFVFFIHISCVFLKMCKRDGPTTPPSS